jgi:hypothetical protein
MSVCFFGVAELTNVAAAVLNATPKVFRKWSDVSDVACALELVSQANATAYATKYNAYVEAVRKTEIEEALFPRYVGVASRGEYKCDLAGAVSTARLLRYNCMDARDYLEITPGAAVALAEILQKMMTACAAKAGLLPEGA